MLTLAAAEVAMAAMPKGAARKALSLAHQANRCETEQLQHSSPLAVSPVLSPTGQGTIDFEKTRKRLITENYYDQRKLLRITKTLTTIGFQVSIFRANNPSDVYSQVFVYYTGILLT